MGHKVSAAQHTRHDEGAAGIDGSFGNRQIVCKRWEFYGRNAELKSGVHRAGASGQGD